LKKTAINKATELAAVLMEKGTLIAPVKEDAGFNFREISDAKQVDLNFHNTIISPKSAFSLRRRILSGIRRGNPSWRPHPLS